MFCPAGDILELAILRSQGRSKGCAFLTYASRQQVRAPAPALSSWGAGWRTTPAPPARLLPAALRCAAPTGSPTRLHTRPSTPLQAEAAIHAFNGRQVSPSKRLVVKFADQKA